jgi:hypothetical protein
MYCCLQWAGGAVETLYPAWIRTSDQCVLVDLLTDVLIDVLTDALIYVLIFEVGGWCSGDAISCVDKF